MLTPDEVSQLAGLYRERESTETAIREDEDRIATTQKTMERAEKRLAEVQACIRHLQRKAGWTAEAGD